MTVAGPHATAGRGARLPLGSALIAPHPLVPAVYATALPISSVVNKRSATARVAPCP